MDDRNKWVYVVRNNVEENWYAIFEKEISEDGFAWNRNWSPPRIQNFKNYLKKNSKIN